MIELLAGPAFLVAILAGWLILQAVILPRMGVRT
jgi:hypothetical protein